MLYERVYENVRRRREGEKEEVKIPRDALASSYPTLPIAQVTLPQEQPRCVRVHVYAFMSPPDITV